LGYDRETVQRYRAETDRANLRTLKSISLLAMALIVLLLILYGEMLRKTEHMVVICIFSVFLIMAYYYITDLLRGVSAGPIRGVRSLVYLISVVMYLFGILSGTLLSDGELGVLGVWMFLLVQISFDLPPMQNALTVIPFAALFLIVGRQFKSLERWQMDVLYTNISVVVGLYISHHQSKLALDNIIAQSNLQKANFALYHTATTDELTGLMNRRMLFDRYDAILSECTKSEKSMACVVLDIDDYKQYNDKYGHPEGDALLRGIGGVLLEYSKQQQIDIGRIGGEEFLAVWPEEDTARCEQVAEELRRAIERMGIPHSGALDHDRVTMSVGLCLLPSTMAQGAYLYADKALYRAKDAGKNCSCRYDPATNSYRMLRGSDQSHHKEPKC
jgi:diguanylate cyclase (GGDEF)-like protein